LSHIVRDPKIIWRVEKQREEKVRQALEAGDEPSEAGTVILVVSGTMHQLNFVGGSIWQLCDGTRDCEAIVSELAQEFDVEREQLAADVQEFVDDLVDREWLYYE